MQTIQHYHQQGMAASQHVIRDAHHPAPAARPGHLNAATSDQLNAPQRPSMSTRLHTAVIRTNRTAVPPSTVLPPALPLPPPPLQPLPPPTPPSDTRTHAGSSCLFISPTSTVSGAQETVSTGGRLLPVCSKAVSDQKAAAAAAVPDGCRLLVAPPRKR